MTKFFHLTKKTKVKNLQPKNKKMSISIKLLNLIIVGLIIFSGTTYLVQMNSLAIKGYKIEELQTKIDELNQEGENLELQVSELQSVKSIKDKVSQLNMVSDGKVEYLAPTPVALAPR